MKTSGRPLLRTYQPPGRPLRIRHSARHQPPTLQPPASNAPTFNAVASNISTFSPVAFNLQYQFEKSEWQPFMKKLIDLYIFADMTRIIHLKNDVIDALADIHTDLGVVPSSSFTHAWNNTMPGSSLRRLIIAWLVWESFDDDETTLYENMSADMVIEFMKEARSVVRAFTPLCVEEFEAFPPMNPHYEVEKNFHEKEEASRES